MYIIEFDTGTYQIFDTFRLMLKTIKQLNKIGFRKYRDYTWKRIEKPVKTIREYVAFDEF